MKSKQGLDRRAFMGRGAVAAGVVTGGVFSKTMAAAKNEGSSAGAGSRNGFGQDPGRRRE